MANIHGIPEDETSAMSSNIVGTHYVEGRCYYEGRPQGGRVAAKTEEELIILLSNRQREIIEQQGSVVEFVYPNEKSWEIRIFNP